MYKISVLVCTYNSTWEELQRTLDSVVSQNLENVEIIVADDGSKRNYQKELETYFARVDFADYKLVMQPENRGTVKNMLSGARAAGGKYIKPIGSGDWLLHKDSLDKIYHFMEQKKAKCAFSDLLIFSIENEEHIVHSYTLPIDKKCYSQGHSTAQAIENIIVYNDHISGSSLFYERQFFVEKLLLLEDNVIYMEDLIQHIALLDGETIYYFDEKCVAYEVGTGISTLNNAGNNERMIKDQQSFLDYLYHTYENDPYVKRRKRLEEIQRMNGAKVVKVLKKCLAEPKWLFLRWKQRRIV